jgi:hypothetical protein
LHIEAAKITYTANPFFQNKSIINIPGNSYIEYKKAPGKNRPGA